MGPQSQVNYNYSENNLGIGMRVSGSGTVATNQSYLNNPDYEMYPETCRTTTSNHDESYEAPPHTGEACRRREVEDRG